MGLKDPNFGIIVDLEQTFVANFWGDCVFDYMQQSML